MKPTIVTKLHIGVSCTLMEYEKTDGPHPCTRCAFSKDSEGCYRMGDRCTESTFWYDLSKEPQEPRVTLGEQYRLVTNDPRGGCRKCAVDLNSEHCDNLYRKGCTDVYRAYWVKK